MKTRETRFTISRPIAITLMAVWFAAVLLVGYSILTYQPGPQIDATAWSGNIQNVATPTSLYRTPDPNAPILSPTPDPPKQLPTVRTNEIQYTVQPNDTLGKIAIKHGVSLNALIEANQITDPDILNVGQVLTIPAQEAAIPSTSFKIIPDSELVYSPASIHFDIRGFIQEKGGYLANYYEVEGGDRLSGAEIVELVSQQYSVNPRILLAVLEFQSGWVTKANPAENSLEYPMLYFESWRNGLYSQLAWAANNLNRGYYLWKINAMSTLSATDGSSVSISPEVNAGTAGVYYLMSLLYDANGWQNATSADGLIATFTNLFGYPFGYAYEPLIPPDLTQPNLQLPFEDGAVWSYTGGPHPGWDDGSAWAGLDFGPPGDPIGCAVSDAWVVAVADGTILRAEDGAVVQELDGDGYEQTGWTIFYMHIAAQGRIKAGTEVKAGQKIGHPSCEGGVSYGAHLHLARRFNGEWIAADGYLPFNLDGWVSSGDGIEYNGYLKRNDEIVEAWDKPVPQNQISR
jgi:LasA protease